MTRSVGEQMANIERRIERPKAHKQRIVAREDVKVRKQCTHLIVQLGDTLSGEGALGYDRGVWDDGGNR